MFTKADAEVARVACRAGGIFHRREARAAGLTDAQIRCRVRNGSWIEILPRVFRLAGTPIDHDVMRRAALAWAGGDAVLSHRSAGAALQLDRVDDPRPEIALTDSRCPRSELVIVHRRRDIAVRDTVRVGDMRCTSVPRTIVDLATVLRPAELEIALESVRRRYGVPIRAIRQRTGELAGPGRHGIPELRRLLDALEGEAAAESVLEVIVAQHLRGSRLPPPVRQYWIEVFGRR